MAGNLMPGHSLPAETRAIVWRIFGSGESPLTGRTSYELIEPVVRKHVSPTEHGSSIAEICGWFDSHEDRRWLKPEMRESVAALILEGIGSERSETAIWAIGSIGADLAASSIRSRWSPEEIDSFVERALAALETLCDQDEVLDATRIAGYAAHGSNARIPRDTLEREGKLETFRSLQSHGFELVYDGLHPAAGNLIGLLLELRPERFASLIERLDHPVIQARAAYHVTTVATPPLDFQGTLRWITEGSCDALVALAILYTLNGVNRLDDDIRSASRMNTDRYIGRTELRSQEGGLDTAADNLLTGLVDRLATLGPLKCARWIGELLSGVPYVLYRGGNDNEKPKRIEQLECACTELLARLVRHSWSKGLAAALRAGLCLTPRTTWPRHMAEVAWEVRNVAPARATELACLTLEEDERHIAEEIERNHLFLHWNDWHDREWIRGLGMALALSRSEIDLPNWVAARCRSLPLTVWDAEESHEAFSTADRAVQHWFLVALLAIPALKELGHVVEPASVRALSEKLWAHCHFAAQYLIDSPEVSVATEHAARYAVEFGEPSDAWLLSQARDPGVGPRALWALIDQRIGKKAREGRTDDHYNEMITAEIVSAASERFGDGGQFDLDALQFWGRLWFLLGAVDNAEQTAMAIIAFRPRLHDRANRILALKLLALVANTRKLTPAVAGYAALFHDQLWRGYTPDEERADRQEVDALLERSNFFRR